MYYGDSLLSTRRLLFSVTDIAMKRLTLPHLFELLIWSIDWLILLLYVVSDLSPSHIFLNVIWLIDWLILLWFVVSELSQPYTDDFWWPGLFLSFSPFDLYFGNMQLFFHNHYRTKYLRIANFLSNSLDCSLYRKMLFQVENDFPMFAAPSHWYRKMTTLLQV